MKRFLLILLALATLSSAFAQKKTKLTGRVFDSESGEALTHSTVQLLKPDTVGLVSGAISNTNGFFTMKDIPVGNYVMKISYIGYHNFFHKVEVTGEKSEQNVGTIMLVPSSIELQTAVVTAALKPIEVKEDTIIFNADAFKVPEGSVLEELIRKLPGAEVGDDGSIKINGKTVSKILVDGKEFFGNDKSMSMKNLPTEIVDKVKTYDRQSDMARMTGIDDGEEETVIDLSIKKGMKQGWFGNFDLAGGTHERYSESAMVNRFQDRTQASVIGNINNTNDRTGGGGGRGGNSGETTTKRIGATLALERGQFEIGGNARYSGSKSSSWTKSASQNFVTTNTSFSNAINRNVNRNHSINGDFRIEWKVDSMTTMQLRPNFSFGGNNSNGTGENATFNADPYEDGVVNDPLRQMDLVDPHKKVNYNQTGNRSKGNNNNVSANFIFNRRLNNLGRNFSIRANGSYSNSESKSYSLSDIRYFQYRDSTRLTYRYRTTPNSNKNYSIGANYSEPIIARKLFLQTQYRFSYQKRHSDGSPYDLGNEKIFLDSIRSVGAGYLPYNYRDYLDGDLSRYTDNENKTHLLELQLRLVTTAINMNVGVNIEEQHQKIDYDYQKLDTVASRDYWRVSPTLNFRYRFNRQHTLRIRYRGSSRQPDMTDLFNMTDNSNPLNIRMGNPNLKPSFNTNVNVDWNNYLTTTMQNFNARLSYSTTKNSITTRTEYNEITGGRITQPQNINGDWSISGNFGFTTPLFVDKFTLSTNTSANYNNNVGYIYQDKKTLKNTVKNTSIGERLNLQYRADYWSAGAYGNLNYSHVRSELVNANNRDTYNFSYGANFNMTLENGIGFSTDIGMNSRRGYSSEEMNTNELIWNAQASYRFLKRRNATIALRAYDILYQRSNISRTINATMRRDQESNAINSYVMCHFIYRFNLFGTREARQNLRNSRNFDGGFNREAFQNENGFGGDRGGF